MHDVIHSPKDEEPLRFFEYTHTHTYTCMCSSSFDGFYLAASRPSLFLSFGPVDTEAALFIAFTIHLQRGSKQEFGEMRNDLLTSSWL